VARPLPLLRLGVKHVLEGHDDQQMLLDVIVEGLLVLQQSDKHLVIAIHV
jgi:hypothetical protein